MSDEPIRLSTEDEMALLRGDPKLPSIGTGNLTTMVQAIKDILEVREGKTGSVLDKALTLRDLYRNGMVNLQIGQNAYNNLDGGGSVSPVSPGAGSADNPLAPTGVTASGALLNVLVQWDEPAYSNHSHAEVWRASTDNLSAAVLYGTSDSRFFTDNVGNQSSHYYWVRFVSKYPKTGPFHSTNGVLGATSPDPAVLLDLLTGEITDSQLHTDLGSRIDLIDAPTTGLQAQLASVNAQIDSMTASIADLQGTPEYDNAATYAIDDIVQYSGGLYRAIASGTGHLPTNATYWEKIGDYASLGDAVAAHSATLSDHETRITDTEDGLVAEAAARTSLATAVTAGDAATLTSAQSYVQTYAYSKSATDSAIASSGSTLTVNYTNADTSTLNSAKSYADTKKSEAITAAHADVVSYAYSKAASDSAIAASASTLTTAYQSADAATLSGAQSYVQTYAYSKSTVDGAIASSATTLQSQINQRAASFKQQAVPTALAVNDLWIDTGSLNVIRNNTMVGAVVGTPGTRPTNWGTTLAATNTGITATIAATGTEDGINYIDVQYTGTATATSAIVYQFDVGPITAAQGQNWTTSCYLKLVSGAFNGATIGVRVDEQTSAGVSLGATSNTVVPTGAALGTQRYSGSRNFANASAGRVLGGLRLGITSGTVYNFTLRIGMPQLEQAAAMGRVIATSGTTVSTVGNNQLYAWDGSKWVAADDARLATLQIAATTSASAITGLQAQYTVKTDLNGYVSGFGLASEAPINATPSSTFAVRADQFYIANPAGPGVAPATPFIVRTTSTTINGQTVPIGVYIKDAFIQNGSIGSAQIGLAVIDDAHIASLNAAKITAGDVAAARMSANIVTALSGKFSTLSALVASLGTVQIDASGYLRTNGATAYGTGTGIWMGQDSGVYKLRIGNPSGNRLQWDGTALNIVGSGTFTGTVSATAGDIGGNTITSTAVSSPTFVSSGGATGWQIKSDGSATFNNVKVRGDIQATSINGSSTGIVATSHVATNAISSAIFQEEAGGPYGLFATEYHYGPQATANLPPSNSGVVIMGFINMAGWGDGAARIHILRNGSAWRYTDVSLIDGFVMSYNFVVGETPLAASVDVVYQLAVECLTGAGMQSNQASITVLGIKR